LWAGPPNHARLQGEPPGYGYPGIIVLASGDPVVTSSTIE
jgi:hypothetical protein